jgi:hypothetical protein
MENIEFQLTPFPTAPTEQDELFVESVIDEIQAEQEQTGRCPLQCVTYKMPLPLYLEFKKVAQANGYTMTDIVNKTIEKVVPVLKRKASLSRAVQVKPPLRD